MTPTPRPFTRTELDLVMRWLRQRCDQLSFERLLILLCYGKDESSLPEENQQRLESLRTEEAGVHRCIRAAKLAYKGNYR